MKKGLVGVALGAVAALGGAWAAKKLLGSEDESEANYTSGGATSASTEAPPPRREGLDPVLLEILACPDDKQPVIYQKEGDAERLTCTKCGKRYPVRDGIPVMLIDEAESGPIPTEAEVAAAKAVAAQGKPAIVGTAAPPDAPVAPAALTSTTTSTSASMGGAGSATPAGGTGSAT